LCLSLCCFIAFFCSVFIQHDLFYCNAVHRVDCSLVTVHYSHLPRCLDTSVLWATQLDGCCLRCAAPLLRRRAAARTRWQSLFRWCLWPHLLWLAAGSLWPCKSQRVRGPVYFARSLFAA
jgi:hypothetical protein